MANEFKVKNGLIVIGDLTTSGTITINGALAATQSWVTSQAYLTSASLSGYATQSYVTSAIASLVDSAPAALDTLKELATALGNDASFATTVTNSIASKQAQLNGTGLVRMSGTTVSYDNTTYLISNFGNIEGEHGYGYPSSDGWYKIAEVVLNGACQSYNLWGEYRDTGYFDNSHYRIHITARAECDFPSNNESHAINVNIYGSSTNETYFTNNVRVILTSSSSNYRKYELQYYRATWDTGSWRLQTLGWTTYATSQTAGTSTGTPRVYYISKFVADNIYAANKISIGTSYSGFAANIAGTTYIIGGSVWTQNGYGFTNSGSNNTGMFPDSNHVITFKNNNSDNVTINASGNVGIGTSSPAQKLHVEGIARLGGSTTDGALYVYSSNGTLNSLISGPGNTYLNATYGNVGVGVNPTSGDKLEVAGSVRIHTGNNWDGIQIYAGGQDGYIRGIGDEVGLHIRSEYGNVLLADDRGKVGIGFTTPQKKLDVYGTGIVASFGGTFSPGDFAGIHFGYSESNLNNDSYKKSALVFERTDNNNQGGNASGKIHFLLNNSGSSSATALTASVVTIDSDANGTIGSVRMGIGTRNPSYPLEVNGGATSNNIARFTTGGVGGGTRGLTMYSDNSQLKLQVSDNVGGIGSWAFLNLNPDGGNVGIGTTAPDEKLQVAGNIKIQNETGLITDYGPLVGRYNTSQVYVGTGGNYSIVKIGRADGGALNVLSGGNVGIGTSTPSEKLEVYGNSYVSGQSFLRSHFSSYTTDGLFNANALWSGVLTPSGVYRVRFGYLDQGGGQYWGRVGFVGNTNWSLGTAQGGHSFSIGTGNGNSEFLINNAGKVSIGTIDTNSDKSDFTVYTGGNTSIALAGNLFRVGEGDINWDIALRSNGFLETYAQPLYLRTITGSQPVVIGPNGTNTVEFYPDYTLFNGLNLAISRTNSTHGAGNYFRGDASHLVIGTGGTLYLNYGGGTTIITGNTTVSGLLGVTGIVSANARKLSLGILDLNTSGVPGQFKIKTSIPWNYGGSDFTVNIKGFRYGSSQMVSLSIGWHFYNNEFYSRNAICNGAWAPTISLAKSPDGYVIIHLPSPDYWAKLYVESVYSSNSADSYTSGWSWSDADLSDCTLIQTVPYRDLATNISGNAATATFATTAGALSSMNISQFTNNSGYITGYTETDTLQSVTSRGATTTNRINVRGIGNQVGGNIMMGDVGQGTNKWSYLTGTHYNASSQPQGFALIGGLSTDSFNAVVIGGNIYETNPATEIQFWTHSATTHNLGGTQRGVINSAGNWGIGTASPSAKLHLYESTAADVVLRLTPSDGGYDPLIQLTGQGNNITQEGFEVWYDNDIGDVHLSTTYVDNAASIHFHTRTGASKSTSNERLTILGGGNVGVGISTPSEKLHVSGAAIFDGGAGNSSTDSVVYITKSNNNDWGLYVNASGLDYGMYARVSPSAGYAIGVNNGTDWTTRITGNAIIYLGEKNAIEGNYDTWLRLNNSNHYTSGVYTPGVMRADGGFYVSGNTVIHSGTIGSQSVNYANSAGSASTAATATDGLRLLREDNRTISPSELTAGYLKFGFTSWTNDNSGPYADFLHLRSYTDASGGNDNLVMFLKNGIGMRIYQQSWGTTAPYSSYVDVWTTGNFTQSNVNNWNTAYGWGNHASQGYATTSYVTTQINNLINGAPGALDTLDELAAALGDDANFATTVTNSIASKLSLSGGTMTGQILFQTSALNNGFRWDVNSDAAGITFKNTGDGDNNSYFNFFTEDNGNEYFKFSHNTWNIGSFDFMDVKNGVVRTNGNIYVNASQSGTRSAGTNELINGNRVWHDGDFSSSNISNWNTAYGWGNHASAGYALNSSLANYLPLSGGVIGGAVTINGNLTVNGTITENSSIKLKENIETSEGNLEKVVNLRPVTYNKIGSQTTELGLIAEEVAEVYPEFVQYDENGEPIGVHYSRLTAALIGAVKELTNQVQELNKKING